MNFGFVYLLGNPAMPCYYKIGCTERAPHARAKELSAASGVPRAFHVLAYIEVNDFQRVERSFHSEMDDFRAASDREFFCFGPAHMPRLWWAFRDYPGVLSFATPEWHRYARTPQFPEDHEETWVFDGEHLSMPNSPPIEAGDLRIVL